MRLGEFIYSRKKEGERDEFERERRMRLDVFLYSWWRKGEMDAVGKERRMRVGRKTGEREKEVKCIMCLD